MGAAAAQKCGARERSSPTTKYNVMVGRGKSRDEEAFQRSAAFEEPRLCPSSLSRFGEKMNKRLKKEEEERSRVNQRLDELIRRMNLPGVENEFDSPPRDLDSS